jgi:hypothetical protein
MWKENFRKRMVDDLFEKQTKLNKQDLDAMFDKNNKLVLGYYEIIVFEGNKYRKHSRVKSWAAAIELSLELKEEMSTIIKERDSICEDRRTLEAWYRALCFVCSNPDDVVNALPKCLHYILSYPPSPDQILEYKNPEGIPLEAILELVGRRKLINTLLN